MPIIYHNIQATEAIIKKKKRKSYSKIQNFYLKPKSLKHMSYIFFIPFDGIKGALTKMAVILNSD